MKLFSLGLRHVFILSFMIIVSSGSALQAGVKADVQPDYLAGLSAQQRCVIFDNFAQNWEKFEDFLTQTSDSIANFVSNIFNFSFFSFNNAPYFKYDVTLVGFVNYADGIGRHPILFKECLENNVNINFVSTRNMPQDVEDAQLGLPRLDPNRQEDIGAVAILTDILADKASNIYKKVPNSLIKIAYTMFEATEIPCNWATILNSKFDMAVVPDDYLCDVYKKAGVRIPIFVLPLPLLLNDFLDVRQRQIPHKQFVFGMTAGFWKRKNHIRVLEAFATEFGNNPDFKLKLHGRFGENEVIAELAEKIQEYQLTNVELIVKPYSREEYLEFFKSLDCYVFLSMGEGFSITPREALACGKPCILTNNTAQTTICNTGTVRVVPSNVLVPALYDFHYDNHYSYGSSYPYPNGYGCGFSTNRTNGIKDVMLMSKHDFFDEFAFVSDVGDDEFDLLWRTANIGYQFDCLTADARQAMRDVYENYHHYVHKARRGRDWVRRYLHKNLSSYYVSLAKPEYVVLGDENIISSQGLMTTSKALYEKYQYLLGN